METQKWQLLSKNGNGKMKLAQHIFTNELQIDYDLKCKKKKNEKKNALKL